MDLSLLLALGAVILLAFWLLSPKSRNPSDLKVQRNGQFKNQRTPDGENVFDVLIAGGGPAGSTCAYFLAQSGKRVAVLERKRYPRDKFCGDAVCEPAIALLEEMGMLDKLMNTKQAAPVQRGGFVSPRGYNCVGGPYGSVSKCRTYAIKRILFDAALAAHAQQNGNKLIEETEVTECKFSSADGMWTVQTKDGPTYQCRMLVVADGSNSYIGKRLGISQGAPTAVCSRHYVAGDSHNWKDDGVIIYSRAILPGYIALFKHVNGDVDVAIYILPGGKVTARDIPKIEEAVLSSCEYVKNAIGEKPVWKERLRTAPLRLGGEQKSFGDHVVLIGDAAGQIDPLTGEGIHTAMEGGKMAAQTIDEMFEEGDFSAKSCEVYHKRWMSAFGDDFYWSLKMAQLIYRFPILLDALCVVGKRRGQSFLDEFGIIMTGVKPKTEFLRMKYVIPISFELIRQIFLQYVLCKKPLVTDFAKSVVINRKAKYKSS